MTIKRINTVAENMRKTLDGSTANYIQQRFPGIDIVLGKRDGGYFLMFWRRDTWCDYEEAAAIAAAFGISDVEPDTFESKDLGGKAFVHRYAWTERQAVAA